MKVEALMRKNPKTVRVDTPLDIVWNLIAKEQIHIVPVVDEENRIQGIITGEDLLITLIPNYREFFSDFYPIAPTIDDISDKLEKQSHLFASDVMNKTVYSIYHHHDVFKALSRMMAYNKRILPVIDDDDKLLGFIVEKDIFKHIFDREKHILKKLRRKK